MKKQELIDTIANETLVPKKKARQMLDVLISTIKKQVAANERVEIRDFGIFYMKHKAERSARNLSTGETITIPAKDVPVFKVSKKFLSEE